MQWYTGWQKINMHSVCPFMGTFIWIYMNIHIYMFSYICMIWQSRSVFVVFWVIRISWENLRWPTHGFCLSICHCPVWWQICLMRNYHILSASFVVSVDLIKYSCHLSTFTYIYTYILQSLWHYEKDGVWNR